jgi:hypothetical protein
MGRRPMYRLLEFRENKADDKSPQDRLSVRSASYIQKGAKGQICLIARCKTPTFVNKVDLVVD